MDRHEAAGRLRHARLYFIFDLQTAPLVPKVLAGGADVLQLRDKEASDEDLVRAGRGFVSACRRHGALFVMNDRPDLALECQADGVHVGQEDEAVDSVRRHVGERLVIGVSTHSPEQVDAAEESDADYFAVGPVHATPTKPGRPAVGLELVRYAADHARKPWFAIGGIDIDNADQWSPPEPNGSPSCVRLCVDDPREAARELRGVAPVG